MASKKFSNPGIESANKQANKRLEVIRSRIQEAAVIKEANEAANRDADKILGSRKRPKFKLKTKPQLPDESLIRTKKVEVWSDHYLHSSLGTFIAELQKIHREHPDATIEAENDYGGCYYESDRPSIKIVVSATQTIETQYNEAYDKYIVELEKYTQWYTANKVQIEEELAYREAEGLVDLEKRAKRLETEAAKIRKKLGK